MLTGRSREAAAKSEEGVRLMQMGDLERAVAAFTEAIALDPKLYDAYRRRAVALRRLDRAEEAEADSRKADSLLGGATQTGQEGGVGRTAFAWTAVPIVALSVLSMAGVRDQVFYDVWYVAGAVWLFALVSTTVVALRRHEELASGMLAGFGIGTLALIVAWFVNTGTA